MSKKREYLQAVRNKKTGRVYYYLRKPGHPRVAIPRDNFDAAYAAALTAGHPTTIGAAKNPRGSVAALIGQYFESSFYKHEVADRTRARIRQVLNKFRDQYGADPVARVERRHMVEILAKLPPWPRKNWVKVLRPMFQFAVDVGMLEQNPLADIIVKIPRSAGFREWTPEAIEIYRGHHPIGSMPRLALELLYHTGARSSDVIRLGPRNVWAGKLTFTMEKTDSPITMPLLTELQQAIAATPAASGATFLALPSGRPFSQASWQLHFARWVSAADLPPSFRAHGLRKASAIRIAHNGGTAKEIQAWLGHRNMVISARYVEKVDENLLRDRAADKLRTEIVKSTTPVVKNRGKIN
jgi:integrase